MSDVRFLSYFCTDLFFFLLCVAELGRDALSVQTAPHDPGAGLQYVSYTHNKNTEQSITKTSEQMLNFIPLEVYKVN